MHSKYEWQQNPPRQFLFYEITTVTGFFQRLYISKQATARGANQRTIKRQVKN